MKPILSLWAAWAFVTALLGSVFWGLLQVSWERGALVAGTIFVPVVLIEFDTKRDRHERARRAEDRASPKPVQRGARAPHPEDVENAPLETNWE